MPGALNFSFEEVRRIEDAQLMLMGIAYGDLERMSLQARLDLLEIAAAQNNPKKYLYGK